MRTQEEYPQETVARTVRFSSARQVATIKKAAKEQGLPFNTFVRDVSETAASHLLTNKRRDAKQVLAAAIHEALTESAE